MKDYVVHQGNKLLKSESLGLSLTKPMMALINILVSLKSSVPASHLWPMSDTQILDSDSIAPWGIPGVCIINPHIVLMQVFVGLNLEKY